MSPMQTGQHSVAHEPGVEDSASEKCAVEQAAPSSEHASDLEPIHEIPVVLEEAEGENGLSVACSPGKDGGGDGSLPTLLCTRPSVSGSLSVASMARKSMASASGAAADMAKTLTDRRKISRFLFDICLMEVLVKQLPMAMLLAVPVIVTDIIVGRALAPMYPLKFDSEEHRRLSNATFNVHVQWNYGSQDPEGVIGSYRQGNIGLLFSAIIFPSWVLIVAPKIAMSSDAYKKATPKCYTFFLFFVYVPFMAVLYWMTGAKASNIDGDHNYALVGSISPVLIGSVIYALLALQRGRRIGKVVGNNLMLIAMIICLTSGTITAFEVVGIMGSRKENVIFLYRLVIWPLFWYFLLVPLFRYILVTWAGEPTQILPLLAFFLSVSSVSSRALIFNIENKVYFLILTIADASLQTAFNLHYRDNPIIDRFMLRTCWRRCMALPQQDATRVSGSFDPTGSLVFVDPARQRFVRMLWFQAQSIAELCTIFGASLRVWAFYDARYIFALFYQEQCETFRDGFPWADWGLKLAFSVVTVLVSDMGSSYFAYIQGFPLRESFHALTKNVMSWISFSYMNFGGMMLLLPIISPIVGRMGNCADFDNGCTCENIKLYRELCGCCPGVGEAATNYSQRLAQSAYALCRG